MAFNPKIVFSLLLLILFPTYLLFTPSSPRGLRGAIEEARIRLQPVSETLAHTQTNTSQRVRMWHVVLPRQTDDVHYQAVLRRARQNSCSQISLIYHNSNESVRAGLYYSISEPLNQLSH